VRGGGIPRRGTRHRLTVTRGEAGRLIDDAIYLTSRLPRTLAQMAAGLVDAGLGMLAMPDDADSRDQHS